MRQLIFSIAVGTIILTTACNTQKKVQDNAQGPQEQRRQGQGGPPSIDDLFKMDTNADGKLSKAEVKGPLLNDFSKIDKNGDGFLSKIEVQNAPKPAGRKVGPRQ